MIGSDPGSSPAPADVQATFCATLVDEWIRRGVSHAVIAPGSRSTPMAIALAERADIAVHVVHDERSAAFVALGLGLDGTPALLLCTSGTAAANFYPAVVEAGLSEVPLIVLTADRPEELRGVGAPQTIDQVDLYGSHVRQFHDPGVPTLDGVGTWRTLATDVVAQATAGPVHMNLQFREPLIGSVGELPPVVEDALLDDGTTPNASAVTGLAHARGLILVGGRSGVAAVDVALMAERTGWPIIADPLSGMRHLDHVVSYAESMLRSPAFADRVRPAVVVRVGRPATSKTLSQWIDRCVADHGTALVQVGGPGRIDPGGNVTTVSGMHALLSSDVAPAEEAWRAAWLDADRAAEAAITAELDAGNELNEPRAARVVADHLPPGARLIVASSMPVRDLEWFGGPAARAYCNRGANGIDGVTSTGLGMALSGPPTVVLIGDLAFTHDINALVGLVRRDADLRVVVIDNDGGAIFSFLPQAELLDHDRFEQLFGTPLGVDVLALAAAHGITTARVKTMEALAAWMATPGPWVVRVPSDRAVNVEVHAALHAAASSAVEAGA